jgi:hypothetical protein
MEDGEMVEMGNGRRDPAGRRGDQEPAGGGEAAGCRARKARIVRRSSSFLMRVKSFSRSWTTVAVRSKGSRAYIFPPAKWQGWQRAWRMGSTRAAKRSGAGAAGGGAAADRAGARGAWRAQLTDPNWPQAKTSKARNQGRRRERALIADHLTRVRARRRRRVRSRG